MKLFHLLLILQIVTRSLWAAPTNDNFAKAQLVSVPTGGVTVAGSNLDATIETDEPNNHGDNSSIWYRITPAAGVSGITITAVGAGFPPEMAVYRGTIATGLTALQRIDTGRPDFQRDFAEVDFAVPAGSTDAIFLAVGSSFGGGAVLLTFTTFTPAANDAFANAQLVTVPPDGVTVQGSNLGATRETNEPVGIEKSVWYRIDPAVSGTGIRITAGRDMAVYRGSIATGLSSLLPIVAASYGQVDFEIPTGSTDTFFLAVGSVSRGSFFSSRGSAFQLNFTTFVPPSNDDFADAQLVNVPTGGVSVQGSNLGATRETSEPSGHGSEKSVWYRIDPAAVGKGIRITSAGSGFSPEMVIYRGSFASGVSALVPVATGNFVYVAAENYIQVDYVVPPGSTDTFFLAVGSQSFGGSGSIQLNFTTFIPPSNDAFANAQPVNVPSGGATISGSNLDATREPSEPTDHGSQKSVWYRIDPSAVGKGIRITSAGSGFSPEMAVYRGSFGAGFSTLVMVDTGSSVSDAAGNYKQVDFVIPVGSTDTFFLAVGSYSGGGSIQLNFTQFILPANDAFANAQLVNVLTGGVTVPGSNLGATRQTSELNNHGSRKSVWYRIDPSAVGKKIYITSLGTAFDPQMAVYRGSFAAGLSALTPVGGGSSSSVDFLIPSGSTDTYFLAVGSYGSSGSIQLNFSQYTLPANDAFANGQLVNVPSGGVTVSGSNLGATPETGEPNGHASEKSVWYRIASPAAGTGLLITVSGQSFFPTMAVYRGTLAGGFGSLIVVQQSTSRSDFVVPNTSGGDYFIAVGSFGSAGPFSLKIETFVPPANDNLANAQVVGVALGSSRVLGSNLGATPEGPEDGEGSIWYRIKTPLPGTRFSIETTGSQFETETKIGVYTGNPAGGFSGLTLVSGGGFDVPDGPPRDYLIRASSSSVRGGIELDIKAIANPALIITGVLDGALPGGLPKAVELYALRDIPDLGIYAIGVADNGEGSDGPEVPLSGTLKKGEFFHISAETPGFTSFFGFPPDLVSSALSFNGDDAVELFYNPDGALPDGDMVIDSLGRPDVDGTGEAWEYTDSWAYRIQGSTPNLGTFTPTDWYFLGPGGLIGRISNMPPGTTSFPIAKFLSRDLVFPGISPQPFERFDGGSDSFDLDHKTITFVPVDATETDPNKWTYRYTVSDAPVPWLDLPGLDPNARVSGSGGLEHPVSFPFYGGLRSMLTVNNQGIGGTILAFDGAQQRVILPNPGSLSQYDNTLGIGEVGGSIVIQSVWEIDDFGLNYEARPGPSRYQVELFPTGMIRISFHGVQSRSGGLGIIQGYREPVDTDLSLAQLEFSPAVLEESSGGSPMVALPQSQASIVPYSLLVTPLSALPGNDYLVSGGSGVIGSSGNTSPLPVSILDDSFSEKDERFEVILHDPSDPAWILGRTDFWIIDDDALTQASNNPVLQIVGDRVRILPSTPLIPSGNFMVRILGIEGGSVFGEDGRILSNGALVSLVEAAAGLGISSSGVTFSVEFIEVSTGKVLGLSYHQYTRTGSQPTFIFSGPANVTVQEGTILSLPVELLQAGNLDGERDFSVDHQFVPITATRFSGSSGDFIIQPAEIRNGARTIEIPIISDGIAEGNETFEVRLTNPSPGAILGAPATVVITIQDSSGPAEEGTSPFLQALPTDTAFSTITLEAEGNDWRLAGDPFWSNGPRTLLARRPGLYVTRYPDSGSETVMNGVPLEQGYQYQSIDFTDLDSNPGSSTGYSASIRVPARNGTGSLQLVVEPASGRWRRLGQTAWRNSEQTETAVPAGLQFVEFENSVSDHFPPALLKVNVVTAGTTVSAKYQPKQPSAPAPSLSPLETQLSTSGYPITAVTTGPGVNTLSNWTHIPFPVQSGEFTLTCDVQSDYLSVGSTVPIDALVGLSSSTSVDHWSKVSAVARAYRVDESSDYFWDSHTGGGSCSGSGCFTRLNGVPILDDTKYQLRFRVNVPAKTFSLEVHPTGSAPIMVASNAPFRASANSLGFLTLRNVQGKLNLLAPPRVLPYQENFAGRVESGRGFGSGTVVAARAVLTSADLVFDRDKLSFYEDIAWRCSAGQAGVVSEVNEPSGVILPTAYSEGLLRDDADSPLRDAQNVAVLGFIPRIHPNLPGSGGFSGIRIDDGNSSWKVAGLAKRMPFFPFAAVPSGDLGKMHFLDGSGATFSPLGHGVFGVSTGFSPPPGAEGAALFVQTSGGTSLPAAIYLGSRNGVSLFREIDERIAMAVRATADVQDQVLSDGGHILFAQDTSKGGIYYIESSLAKRTSPDDEIITSANISPSIRWKIKSSSTEKSYKGGSRIGVLPWADYILTFDPAPPGFVLDPLVFTNATTRTIRHRSVKGGTWKIPTVYLPDPKSYQTWQTANYTSTEISSSPITWGVEPDEMALFLGVENVVAYALGFDPKEGTTRNADPDTMTPGYPILRRNPADGELYFEFLRRKDADLRYIVESSGTLGGTWPGSLNASWPNNPVSLVVVKSELVWEHVRCPFNQLSGTAARKFARLRISLAQ